MTVEELVARYNAGQCVSLAKELGTHPAAIRVMAANLRKMGYPVVKPWRVSTAGQAELAYSRRKYAEQKKQQEPIKDWWKARGF